MVQRPIPMRNFIIRGTRYRRKLRPDENLSGEAWKRRYYETYNYLFLETEDPIVNIITRTHVDNITLKVSKVK